MCAMELQSVEAWKGRPEWCEVAVLYEDLPSRDTAIRVCRNLAQNFKEELDFAFTWWKFKYLSDPQIAQQAADAAGRADLIIFSTRSDAELPSEVQDWIEEWVPKRMAQEGAVTVLTKGDHLELDESPLGAYLSSLTRRCQMDFISAATLLTEDTLGALRRREKLVTPLLDEILHNRPRPVSHWGLNE